MYVAHTNLDFLGFYWVTRSVHEVELWYASTCCNIKFLLNVIDLESKGIRVRERRISKSMKPNNEEIQVEGSQKTEASMIDRRKDRLQSSFQQLLK